MGPEDLLDHWTQLEYFKQTTVGPAGERRDSSVHCCSPCEGTNLIFESLWRMILSFSRTLRSRELSRSRTTLAPNHASPLQEARQLDDKPNRGMEGVWSDKRNVCKSTLLHMSWHKLCKWLVPTSCADIAEK